MQVIKAYLDPEETVSDYLLAGRYRLTDRIAAGGMGEVWRGEDQLLNRAVAVKLLPTGRAGDEAFLARFRAEARYAASLSHPGIARVYDYGESSEFGGAYLIMELVKGEPLSAILARAGLSPDATLDIVSQAARALDAAHQAGIVHRDIKPGNLLVAAGGTTKITDFGIATAVRAAQASHLTETGMVMGTAMYVSPEQATGAPVTAASDIYSLGVVAYECLAGHVPFRASEPLAIAYAHKHAPVPPLPPDVPQPVADLVYDMLAKTPRGRPASVRVVADRADMLRDALALGELRGPADPLGVTRADLPAARTGALLGAGGRSGPGPTGPGDRRRRTAHRRRIVLAAAARPRPCAPLAAAAGLYLSGHIAPARPAEIRAITRGRASSPSRHAFAEHQQPHTIRASLVPWCRTQQTTLPSPTGNPRPTKTTKPTPSPKTSPIGEPDRQRRAPTPTLDELGDADRDTDDDDYTYTYGDVDATDTRENAGWFGTVRDTTQPRLLGGRYELDGVVGRGGMAEVYRARDIRLDRIVAIKTLRADLARDQIFQARFRREAQSAASLNHPYIVAVYDTGEDMATGFPCRTS